MPIELRAFDNDVLPDTKETVKFQKNCFILLPWDTRISSTSSPKQYKKVLTYYSSDSFDNPAVTGIVQIIISTLAIGPGN